MIILSARECKANTIIDDFSFFLLVFYYFEHFTTLQLIVFLAFATFNFQQVFLLLTFLYLAFFAFSKNSAAFS